MDRFQMHSKEETGIATITITLIKDVAEAVKPPRSVYVKSPFGSPVGRPGEIETQKSVVRAALEALEHIDRPSAILEPDIKY